MSVHYEQVPEKIDDHPVPGRQFLIEVARQMSEISKVKHNTRIEAAIRDPSFASKLVQHRTSDKIKAYEEIHNLIIKYTGTSTYFSFDSKHNPIVIGKSDTNWKELIDEIVKVVEKNKDLFSQKTTSDLSIDPIILASQALNRSLQNIATKYSTLDKKPFVDAGVLEVDAVRGKDKPSRL